MLKAAELIKRLVHDAWFRQAEKDWYSFVDKLTERLVEIDDTVPELPVKDVVSDCQCFDGHYEHSSCVRIDQGWEDLSYLPRYSVQSRPDSIQGTVDIWLAPHLEQIANARTLQPHFSAAC